MINVVHRVRFTLDHRWVPGRMSDYVDGALALSERRRLEHHTLECPECRGLLRSLQRMLTMLHQLPIPNETRDVASAVRRRLGEAPEP
jgi:anti-sigma factor RsiW